MIVITIVLVLLIIYYGVYRPLKWRPLKRLGYLLEETVGGTPEENEQRLSNPAHFTAKPIVRPGENGQTRHRFRISDNRKQYQVDLEYNAEKRCVNYVIYEERSPNTFAHYRRNDIM